jgi:uncharacterized membrane protein YkoI
MSGSSRKTYVSPGCGMQVMNRAPVHIALLAAFSIGLAAEAGAVTPGIGAQTTGNIVAEATTTGTQGASALAPIYVQSYQYGTTKSGSNNEMIPPSAALQAALGYAPGSQGLGVRLLQGSRLVYAVKLKSGNRIRRVLVDAHTGQVLGE